MILNGKICSTPLTIDDKPLLNIQCWLGTEISTELTVDEKARTVFFIQRIDTLWYIKKKERRYSQIHDLHRSNGRIRGIKFIYFFHQVKDSSDKYWIWKPIHKVWILIGFVLLSLLLLICASLSLLNLSLIFGLLRKYNLGNISWAI